MQTSKDQKKYVSMLAASFHPLRGHYHSIAGTSSTAGTPGARLHSTLLTTAWKDLAQYRLAHQTDTNVHNPEERCTACSLASYQGQADHWLALAALAR